MAIEMLMLVLLHAQPAQRQQAGGQVNPHHAG